MSSVASASTAQPLRPVSTGPSAAKTDHPNAFAMLLDAGSPASVKLSRPPHRAAGRGDDAASPTPDNAPPPSASAPQPESKKSGAKHEKHKTDAAADLSDPPLDKADTDPVASADTADNPAVQVDDCGTANAANNPMAAPVTTVLPVPAPPATCDQANVESSTAADEPANAQTAAACAPLTETNVAPATPQIEQPSLDQSPPPFGDQGQAQQAEPQQPVTAADPSSPPPPAVAKIVWVKAPASPSTANPPSVGSKKDSEASVQNPASAQASAPAAAPDQPKESDAFSESSDTSGGRQQSLPFTTAPAATDAPKSAIKAQFADDVPPVTADVGPSVSDTAPPTQSLAPAAPRADLRKLVIPTTGSAPAQAAQLAKPPAAPATNARTGNVVVENSTAAEQRAPKVEKTESKSAAQTEEAPHASHSVAADIIDGATPPTPRPVSLPTPLHSLIAFNVAPAGALTTAPTLVQPQTAPISLANVPLVIASQAVPGTQRFDIRLDPPELGRIDVRLDIDRKGNVTSRLLVDRPETLDLLRRDAPQIERALQDAGLKTGDQTLQFSLRRSFSENERPTPQPQFVATGEDTTPLEAARQAYGSLRGTRGGIDITV